MALVTGATAKEKSKRYFSSKRSVTAVVEMESVLAVEVRAGLSSHRLHLLM